MCCARSKGDDARHSRGCRVRRRDDCKPNRRSPRASRRIRRHQRPLQLDRPGEKAINDYSEAVRLKPKDALAYSNRGNAWWLPSSRRTSLPEVKLISREVQFRLDYCCEGPKKSPGAFPTNRAGRTRREPLLSAVTLDASSEFGADFIFEVLTVFDV
jgi:hypothetical protein